MERSWLLHRVNQRFHGISKTLRISSEEYMIDDRMKYNHVHDTLCRALHGGNKTLRHDDLTLQEHQVFCKGFIPLTLLS